MKKQNYDLIVVSYLAMYSILRFSMEFIRIDRTPTVLGLRFPQIASIIIFFVFLVYIFWKTKKGGAKPEVGSLPEEKKESRNE